jgi:predicted phosphodiesterase
MRQLFLIFVFILLSQKSLGVPGLERGWKAIHPNSEISCTGCHNSNALVLPSNANVTEQGREKYREILTVRQRGMTIKTKIEPLKKVDFAVMGDSRSDLVINKEVVNQIVLDKPGAVFHTGDMVADGDIETQWQDVFSVYQSFYEKKNLYHVCGNHESNHCTKNLVRKALGNDKAFYTVDFKGFTFVALDSNRVTAEEIQWLSNLPVGKRYIPFLHHPAYPVLAGHSGHDPVIKTFVPQFKRLGVKLVFTGHNHGYDRNEKDGITYVTAGGGGAPLYPCGSVSGSHQACVSDYHYIRCQAELNEIICQAKLLDGSLVDSISVKWAEINTKT